MVGMAGATRVRFSEEMNEPSMRPAKTVVSCRLVGTPTAMPDAVVVILALPPSAWEPPPVGAPTYVLLVGNSWGRVNYSASGRSETPPRALLTAPAATGAASAAS